MTDAESFVEPLRFERTYTSGVDYPTRFARAHLAYNLARPFPWIVLAVAVFAFRLALVAGARNPTLLIPIACGLLLVFVYSSAYFSTLRQVRQSIPTGSVFGIGFRSNTFVLRTPQVTTEYAYALYKSCERRASFVVLRQRVSPASTFLPAEIMTDESFEFLRSKMASQASVG
jgi:hypothetical protein